MANPQNIMKLMAALGGGASEGYGAGKLTTKNGQPMLPKPGISAPDFMSPYAPGNQQGGSQAHLGGSYHTAGPSMAPARNSTKGVVQNEMTESANHPATQLAQYLTTSGAPARARNTRGVDPGAFIRGANQADV